MKIETYEMQHAARPSEQSAIRETISAWLQAAGAKDLNKCVSFYTDDASVLPVNAPIATGKDQIRAVWSKVLSNLEFSWQPTEIEVAQPADLAYEIGTFDFTVADQTGKSSASRGKYVIVWKKQAKGEWKAVADIFNTDKNSKFGCELSCAAPLAGNEDIHSSCLPDIPVWFR